VTPTPIPIGWVTIVAETFEGDFPGAWQVYDAIPNLHEHYWGKRTCRVYDGQFSGWAVGGGRNGATLACGSEYPNPSTSVMRYGPFSLADATAADFRAKIWTNMEPFYDNLCVSASKDGSHFYGQCVSGQTPGWVDWALDLTTIGTVGSLLGQPQVWIAVEFISDETGSRSEGAYIDNVILRKCVNTTCQPGTSEAPPGLVTRPHEMGLE
jgi:hypothetical protein